MQDSAANVALGCQAALHCVSDRDKDMMSIDSVHRANGIHGTHALCSFELQSTSVDLRHRSTKRVERPALRWTRTATRDAALRLRHGSDVGRALLRAVRLGTARYGWVERELRGWANICETRRGVTKWLRQREYWNAIEV